MQVKFVGFAFDGVDGLRHFDEFVAQLSIAPSEPVADGEVSHGIHERLTFGRIITSAWW